MRYEGCGKQGKDGNGVRGRMLLYLNGAEWAGIST